MQAPAAAVHLKIRGDMFLEDIFIRPNEFSRSTDWLRSELVSLVREYSKPDIVQSYPLIELALGTYIDRDCDSLVHVTESGRYKDHEKEYVVLTDVPPIYYITILDNIAVAAKLSKSQVAPFKPNLSFFEMTMFVCASRYLGVENVESYCDKKGAKTRPD